MHTPFKMNLKVKDEEDDSKEESKEVETTLKEQFDKLEGLKDAKRELDQQLEFGLGKELMSDINEQERVIKKAEKKSEEGVQEGAEEGCRWWRC